MTVLKSLTVELSTYCGRLKLPIQFTIFSQVVLSGLFVCMREMNLKFGGRHVRRRFCIFNLQNYYTITLILGTMCQCWYHVQMAYRFWSFFQQMSSLVRLDRVSLHVLPFNGELILSQTMCNRGIIKTIRHVHEVSTCLTIYVLYMSHVSELPVPQVQNRWSTLKK